MTPKRIQMTRQRPWRHEHPDAVIVARPSKWGNPFAAYRCDCCGMWDVRDENGVTYHIDHAVSRGEKRPTGIVLDPSPPATGQSQKREAIERAVELFRLDIAWRDEEEAVRQDLAGRDLACWCPLEDEYGNRVPCHADVLLELANGGVHRERAAGGAVVKGEVLRELRVRIDGRERVVRVRRRIAPTGPRCPEWWHGWCQHPLGHAGPHKWGDR